MGISLQHVGKSFRTSKKTEVQAIKDFSLQIEPRQFVSIVGPSGCGKSTLLRLVAGLLEPSEGVVGIDKREPNLLRAERQIGMVFQDPVLMDWRTAVENVCLPMRVAGYSKQVAYERATELLCLMRLEDFSDAYPYELSGGMKSRVAVARALALSPQLLLMDESFGALDELTRFQLNLELLRLWKPQENTTEQQQPTVLFVTHNVNEAAFLSDRVVVMSDRPGTVVADIVVDLPRPRDAGTLDSAEYFETTKAIRKHLGAAL